MPLTTQSTPLLPRAETGLKALLLLPIAAGLLFGLPTSHAAPANAAASASASSSAAATKSSRALLNQRMRKCKVMSGDEKKACEKDAHAVAATEANKESGAPGK